MDIETLEPTEMDQASGYGRAFAASGGVAGAVKRVLEEKNVDFTVKAQPCSGIKECKVALLKAVRGMLDGNFIEGMACEGGCIMGPAQIIRRPRNKAELAQHVKESKRSILEAVEEAK